MLSMFHCSKWQKSYDARDLERGRNILFSQGFAKMTAIMNRKFEQRAIKAIDGEDFCRSLSMQKKLAQTFCRSYDALWLRFGIECMRGEKDKAYLQSSSDLSEARGEVREMTQYFVDRFLKGSVSSIEGVCVKCFQLIALLDSARIYDEKRKSASFSGNLGADGLRIPCGILASRPLLFRVESKFKDSASMFNEVCGQLLQGTGDASKQFRSYGLELRFAQSAVLEMSFPDGKQPYDFSDGIILGRIVESVKQTTSSSAGALPPKNSSLQASEGWSFDNGAECQGRAPGWEVRDEWADIDLPVNEIISRCICFHCCDGMKRNAVSGKEKQRNICFLLKYLMSHFGAGRKGKATLSEVGVRARGERRSGKRGAGRGEEENDEENDEKEELVDEGEEEGEEESEEEEEEALDLSWVDKVRCADGSRQMNTALGWRILSYFSMRLERLRGRLGSRGEEKRGVCRESGVGGIWWAVTADMVEREISEWERWKKRGRCGVECGKGGGGCGALTDKNGWVGKERREEERERRKSLEEALVEWCNCVCSGRLGRISSFGRSGRKKRDGVLGEGGEEEGGEEGEEDVISSGRLFCEMVHAYAPHYIPTYRQWVAASERRKGSAEAVRASGCGAVVRGGSKRAQQMGVCGTQYRYARRFRTPFFRLFWRASVRIGGYPEIVSEVCTSTAAELPAGLVAGTVAGLFVHLSSLKKEEVWREGSAVAIQSVARGWRVRRILRELKEEREERRRRRKEQREAIENRWRQMGGVGTGVLKGDGEGEGEKGRVGGLVGDLAEDREELGRLEEEEKNDSICVKALVGKECKCMMCVMRRKEEEEEEGEEEGREGASGVGKEGREHTYEEWVEAEMGEEDGRQFEVEEVVEVVEVVGREGEREEGESEGEGGDAGNEEENRRAFEKRGVGVLVDVLEDGRGGRGGRGAEGEYGLTEVVMRPSKRTSFSMGVPPMGKEGEDNGAASEAEHLANEKSSSSFSSSSSSLESQAKQGVSGSSPSQHANERGASQNGCSPRNASGELSALSTSHNSPVPVTRSTSSTSSTSTPTSTPLSQSHMFHSPFSALQSKRPTISAEEEIFEARKISHHHRSHHSPQLLQQHQQHHQQQLHHHH
ncbi:uncharacterized protein MONOS_16874 [Monocercomonoides exilis]|uniref:uncharacterized protein n=1 Tax=Monocercomonoides exilis TaxID=2049356 RepID=UPI00355A4D6C|nr:hypothetical protein MONOS_16874 [Monocercomonoides exilis]